MAYTLKQGTHARTSLGKISAILAAIILSRKTAFAAGSATDLTFEEEAASPSVLSVLQNHTGYVIAGAILIAAVIAAVILANRKKPGRDGGVVPTKKDHTGFTEYVPGDNSRAGREEFDPFRKTEPLPHDLIPDRRNQSSNGARKQEPRLVLTCRGGYMDGREFEIHDTVTIGRLPSNSIKYPDDYPAVSRNHAVLKQEGDILTLCDCSSTVTLLKRTRKPIPKGKPVEVHIGDVFYIGEQKNRFEIAAKY